VSVIYVINIVYCALSVIHVMLSGYYLELKERDTRNTIERFHLKEDDTQLTLDEMNANKTYIVILTAKFPNDRVYTAQTTVTTGSTSKEEICIIVKFLF